MLQCINRKPQKKDFRFFLLASSFAAAYRFSAINDAIRVLFILHVLCSFSYYFFFTYLALLLLLLIFVVSTHVFPPWVLLIGFYQDDFFLFFSFSSCSWTRILYFLAGWSVNLSITDWKVVKILIMSVSEPDLSGEKKRK